MKQRLRYTWDDFSLDRAAYITLAAWAVVALVSKWDAALIWVIPLIAVLIEFSVAFVLVWVDEEPKTKRK